jgi:hypothetical protein
MKKIIKPAEREEAVYYTDFCGENCGELPSPVELTISFNYGSMHDGDSIKLDLNDHEVKPILELIKSKISKDYKNVLHKKLVKMENDYEDSMQLRDWTDCDYKINSLHLLRYMLDLKEE